MSKITCLISNEQQSKNNINTMKGKKEKGKTEGQAKLKCVLCELSD